MQIHQITGCPALCPDSPNWYSQMFSARLPDEIDVETLKNALYDDYLIEVPILSWNQMKLIRVSIQGYNDENDTIILLKALRNLLPRREKIFPAAIGQRNYRHDRLPQDY